jgi:thiamine-monophosphate kinase
MAISGERERLRIIRDLLSEPSPISTDLPVRLMLHAGDQDDCAVYDLSDTLSLVVGTDFVRGTGFRLFQEGLLDYFDLGYYLAVANLSDVAAMGAKPVGLTTVIRYPASLDDEGFIRLVEGIKSAASHYQTPVVGGDIGEYEAMVLVGTAFGVTERGRYLKRGGTKVGDTLCVTGSIGLASTALAYFTRARSERFRLSDEEEQALLAAWKRPVARIQEGLALAGSGVVHACQDVSDGLKATIDQLGQAGDVSFTIYESQLPISPITREVAQFLAVDPIHLALSSSVDFELAFTVEQEALSRLRDEVPVYALGMAMSPGEPSSLIRHDGSRISPIPGTPWEQQRNDVIDIILGGK